MMKTVKIAFFFVFILIFASCNEVSQLSNSSHSSDSFDPIDQETQTETAIDPKFMINESHPADFPQIQTPLFSKGQYKERLDLQGLNFITEEHLISEEEYFQLLKDPITYSTEGNLVGTGELIAGKTKKVIQYNLDFGGGVTSKSISNSINYYELPPSLSNQLSLTRLSRSRSILLDRKLGLFIVITYDNIPDDFKLKKKTFLHVLQFKPDEIRGMNVIGGYLNQDNQCIAVVSMANNSLHFIATDSLSEVHSTPESGWRTYSLFINKERVYLWQLNKEHSLKLYEPFTGSEQLEINVDKVGIKGDIIQIRGDENNIYFATENNNTSNVFQYNRNLQTMNITDKYDVFGDSHHSSFGSIQDIWQYSGNDQMFFIAVFQKENEYPIRLVNILSDNWIRFEPNRI